MKQFFLKTFGTFSCLVLISGLGMAQDNRNNNDTKLDNNQQIIIQKKGDKNTKVTVEIKDGEVKVNGKPLSDFEDENIEVHIESPRRGNPPRPPRSPFRAESGVTMYSDDSRGVLGVITENDEHGAKITSVTKESGAEKAGLKEGDVITKINDQPIENPQALIAAIGKMKPDDKAKVTYRRQDKEQTTTATLGKRSNSFYYSNPQFPDLKFDSDMKLDFPNMPGDQNITYFQPKGRLGIKAQDTDDGKGVKVLDVDDESNAFKAGVRENDIITEFDGKAINSATELADAAKDAKEKNSIKVKVLRNGKPQNFEIKVPKKLKTANI